MSHPASSRVARISRRLLSLVLLPALAAVPSLGAQRAADLRLGVTSIAGPVARDAVPGSGDAMQPWMRHALIGGAIGALGGWLLSGLPCEGAPDSCPSATTSIVAGAVIGGAIGALWDWGHQQRMHRSPVEPPAP